MNIVLPLKFLKPAKISLPKTIKIVSETKKVVIKELEDRQCMFINVDAIIMSKIDIDNDMILMIWHMIDDGVCEIDFGIKIKNNQII